MKARYRPSEYLEFEIDASQQKEIFKAVAELSEVFGESKCGACESTDIHFVCRTVDSNDFFEMKCKDCGAKLAFGQNKTGGTLFPKRKTEKGGVEVYDYENKGWHKYVPDGDSSSKATPNKATKRR